jgi:DNA replication and repair protein RecF
LFLKSLLLQNFRCYERVEFSFAPGLSVVLGPNACGKTSLLEAVYLLAATTSPRAAGDRSLVRWGEAQARVTGLFERDGGELSLRLTLPGAAAGEAHQASPAAKSMELDGRPLGSLRDGVGRAQAVLFWVGELEIVKGSPSARRRFMNAALGQLSRRYLDDLARYRRALRQRNRLLRMLAEGAGDGSRLAPWTQALVEAGAAICADRAAYLGGLAEEAVPLHQRLSGGAGRLEVSYRPSVGVEGDEETVAEAFHRRLEQRHADELRQATTLVGPHRDEVALKVAGVDLRKFGSQGQQRTAALALKLAQARVARRRSDTGPILLFDDCLSELDVDRGCALLDLSGDYEQMIVTSASCPEALRGRLADAHVVELGR